MGRCLEALPDSPGEVTTTALGEFRGLRFGIDRYSSRAASVFFQGEARRMVPLPHDAQGPRAIFNAVLRIGRSHRDEIEATRRE